MKLYLISLGCVLGYFLMNHYNIIFELFEKSSKYRYKGFGTLIITGLLQYVLLAVGIFIFFILSFMLIREKIKKD